MPREPAADAPEASLARWERRLARVREGPMRRELLLEHLEGALDAESFDDAYALLREALRRPEREVPRLPVLRETALELLREGGARRPLGYVLQRELYARAAEQGDEALKRLLRAPDAREAMRDPEAALPAEVSDLPLGVRRALARGRDRARLERLLLDPDPVVVRHLLANPRVTERDVLRLAARRPVAASALREIARHPRFSRRPRVRRALARNPYAPTDLAAHMIASLRVPELRSLVRDATLHPETRRHAADELERRAARPEEREGEEAEGDAREEPDGPAR